MCEFECDAIDLNGEMAKRPTKRFLVVRRESTQEETNVVKVFLCDEESLEKAKQKLSWLVDEDYSKRFHVVFMPNKQEHCITENGTLFKAVYPRRTKDRNTRYEIKIYDALDFAKKISDGYLWQFDLQGAPISSSPLHDEAQK